MRTKLIGMLLLVAPPAAAQATQVQPDWSQPMIDLREEVAEMQTRPMPKLSPEEIEQIKAYKPLPYCMMHAVGMYGVGVWIYDC